MTTTVPSPSPLVVFLLGLSLVFVALAIAESLMIWRRQRDNRVLLFTALLAAVGWRYGLLLWVVAFDAYVNHIAIWVQLGSSVLALGTTFALGKLLRNQGWRNLERDRMRSAIQQVSAQRAASGEVTFFEQAANRITEILGVDYAFIGEFLDEGEPSIRTLSLSKRGALQPSVTYPLAGTPCDQVVGRNPKFWPSHIQERFPEDTMLEEMGAESYLALPLTSTEDEPLGLLAVLDSKPLVGPEQMLPALRILATRAEDELERQRHERELIESETRYRVVFEESQDALFISSPEGNLIDANPAAIELFGYDSKQQILEHFSAVGHYADPSMRERFLQRIVTEGFVKEMEARIRRRDGTTVTVLESATAERDQDGQVVTIRGTLRDITEQRELAKQLARSQRMEAVGRMSGGVAHDFNNVLTVIEGHTELLLERFSEDSEVREDLQSILEASKRAAAFTRRLLLLSRRKVLAPEHVDLRELISELEILLQKAAGADVDVVLELDEETAWVLADRSQLEQVLLNLVINAKDAMPQGGTVRLRTRNTRLGKTRADALGTKSRECVEIVVEDTGVGIAPGVLENIFEPFFTTKDPSIGTGLGLSTVYSIVEQMRGGIAVDSAPGAGTKFRLYIPAQKPGSPTEESVNVEAPPQQGSETVLVVDDDRSVAGLIEQFLARLGYRVLLAHSGEAALAVLRSQPSIRLLLSDVMMPGMSGLMLSEAALEERPELKVLLVSGYAESKIGDGGPNNIVFMPKPFTTTELAREVRTVLDS